MAGRECITQTAKLILTELEELDSRQLLMANCSLVTMLERQPSGLSQRLSIIIDLEALPVLFCLLVQ